MSPGWGAILGGHRPSVRGIRLFTGLIAAAYVISHLVNHSLGILSIEAMDAYRRVNGAIWQSPPGTVLLYGSLLCHLCLGLQALYRRSHLRLKPWEWAQLVLGLAVPFLLIEHIIGARIAPWLIGFDATWMPGHVTHTEHLISRWVSNWLLGNFKTGNNDCVVVVGAGND